MDSVKFVPLMNCGDCIKLITQLRKSKRREYIQERKKLPRCKNCERIIERGGRQ